MKKLAAFIMIVCLLFAAGCSAPKPDSSVSAFIEAGKTLDPTQMAALLNPSDSSLKNQLSEALGDASESRNQYHTYFLDYFKGNAAKITYTLKEPKIEKDQAVVTVDFQYVDGGPLLEAVLKDVFSKAYAAALSGTPMGNEEIGQLLVSAMQKHQATYTESLITKTLDVNLIKVDNKWYLRNLNEDLLDVFLSNYISVSKAFEKAMNPSDDSTDQIISKAVGDEILLKTVTLKVTAVEERQTFTSADNMSVNAAEGMKFVVITAEVTNTTGAAFILQPNLLVVDNSGREFKSYLNTTSVIDDYLDYRQLPPGITQTGSWIYELPTNADSYSLYVRKSGTNELYAILLK